MYILVDFEPSIDEEQRIQRRDVLCGDPKNGRLLCDKFGHYEFDNRSGKGGKRKRGKRKRCKDGKGKGSNTS